MLPRVQYRVLRPTLGAVALVAAVGTAGSCDNIALVAEVGRRTGDGRLAGGAHCVSDPHPRFAIRR